MIKFISSDKFFLPIIFICSGVIIFRIVSRSITGIMKIHIKEDVVANKRKNTVASIIKNIIKYLIAIIVILAILNVYGVDTTSIIAGLGVAGVVIGLAFEDIVKDLIAGIVIIFDNHYEVGDHVLINGFMGEVMSIGLKTTKIKAYTGEVKIISNSAFTEVVNYSMQDYNLLLKINIAYNQSIDDFEKAILEVKPQILKIKGVKELSLLGIDSYNNSSMTYIVEIKCKAMSQYAIKRESLKLIKKKLDDVGIAIPYDKIAVKLNSK